MYPDSVQLVVGEGTLFPPAYCLLYPLPHPVERISLSGLHILKVEIESHQLNITKIGTNSSNIYNCGVN